MRQAKYRFFLLPVLFVLLCVGAFAQANSELTGIVTDQSGAVVTGAKIVLTDPATGITKATESGATGLYEISGLNPANYNLKVTAKGFQSFAQNGIVINVSATVRADIRLSVGAESQTVTVEADALAVQADSNVVSTLINEQQITDLATNGRNVVALAALGLGVSGNLPDSNTPTSVGSSFAISFNGLNQAHNIWLIDGGEAYDRGSGGKSSMMPSQDALAEFQVLASNYPPDYGISSGGTVSMSIKNGTQKLFGELWEFDRNDSLDAHNYFDAPGAKKPELRYNVFGGNIGGPVFIPKVYNEEKKKTFFFYNEEWRKIVSGSAPAPPTRFRMPTLSPRPPISSGQRRPFQRSRRSWCPRSALIQPSERPSLQMPQLTALSPGSRFPATRFPATSLTRPLSNSTPSDLSPRPMPRATSCWFRPSSQPMCARISSASITPSMTNGSSSAITSMTL